MIASVARVATKANHQILSIWLKRPTSLVMASVRSPTDTSEIMTVPGFLNGVRKLQRELGIKIADRIVFHSCNVMTDLSSADVDLLRSFAKNLGTDIVGATSLWSSSKTALTGTEYESVRAARFGADGSVHQDYLTKDETGIYGLFHSFVANGIKYYQGGTPPSDAWFQCHKDATQEEGAACQAKTDPAPLLQAVTDPVTALPVKRLGIRDLSKLKNHAIVEPQNGQTEPRQPAAPLPASSPNF